MNRNPPKNLIAPRPEIRLTPSQQRIVAAAEAILLDPNVSDQDRASSRVKSFKSRCRTPIRATCRSGNAATDS